MKTFTGISCRDTPDNKQHAKVVFDAKLFVYAARRDRWSKNQVPEEHDLLLEHPDHVICNQSFLHVIQMQVDLVFSAAQNMRAYFTFALFIIISVIIKRQNWHSGFHLCRKRLAGVSRAVPWFSKNREGTVTPKSWLAAECAELEQLSVCKGIPNTFSPFGAAKETKLFKEGELTQFMFPRINWNSQRGKVSTSHFISLTSAVGVDTNKQITKHYNTHTSQQREAHSSDNFRQLNTVFKFFPFFSYFITVLKFSFPESGDFFSRSMVKISLLKSA